MSLDNKGYQQLANAQAASKGQAPFRPAARIESNVTTSTNLGGGSERGGLFLIALLLICCFGLKFVDVVALPSTLVGGPNGACLLLAAYALVGC
ncbi:hypothetical protein PIB30_007930 [Stylosanthes scabra]|uniref:Uncharacterized protein n=1 Tax=Stylosanthes scabra TaxID=79078 RepID=A0ABU6S4A3_9FABA|nr:hypothetical protein [Stylosanthes scabra]